jgi:mannose-6-phosphate isomerase
LIAADPEAVLGAAVARSFGGRLPFLIKLLGAATPLSMQVHPTREQARAGFAAEQARGVPRDAPDRNYRDANHKPELLYALTPFEALCGFRPAADTVRLLAALGCPELDPVRELLQHDDLRGAFEWLLDVPEPARLVRSVAERVRALADHADWAGAARGVDLTHASFPDDIGVVLALLLNYARLQPGEAIYLGAGNVHCYLRGLGVEIMANSDNVLRCGLTPKHVDVAELLKITDFSPIDEPRWPPAWADGMGAHFEVPVPDFRLHVVDLDGYRKPGRAVGSCAIGDAGKPYLALCTSGTVTVDVGGARVELSPGHAAFVPAREALFTLSGTGRTVLATVGELAGQT